MEKIIGLLICQLFLITGFVGTAEANPCGKNAYVDEIVIKDDTRTFVCVCLPGFERINDRCERIIPVNLKEFVNLFIPELITGKVDVFWEYDGQKTPVSTEHMFYANVLMVGANGQMTAYLDNEMRLRLSAGAELHLGELLPDDMLTINTLFGTLRLDNHLEFEQHEWVKNTIGKVKQWSNKVINRRKKITIRGNVAVAVRGTDIIFNGNEAGDISIEVVEGEIKLTNLIEGTTLEGAAGSTYLIRLDGEIIEK